MRSPGGIGEVVGWVLHGTLVVVVAAVVGAMGGALVGGLLFIVAGLVALPFGIIIGEYVPGQWVMVGCAVIWGLGVIGAFVQGSGESGRDRGIKDFQRWQEEERKWQELKRQKPE